MVSEGAVAHILSRDEQGNFGFQETFRGVKDLYIHFKTQI